MGFVEPLVSFRTGKIAHDRNCMTSKPTCLRWKLSILAPQKSDDMLFTVVGMLFAFVFVGSVHVWHGG